MSVTTATLNFAARTAGRVGAASASRIPRDGASRISRSQWQCLRHAHTKVPRRREFQVVFFPCRATQSRHLHASTVFKHGHLTPHREGEGRKVTFIDKEGRPNEFVVGDGNNLLDIAQAHDLDMEGACGGSCACSTCHVIVEDEEMYDKLEPADDDEDDMLDLAYGLTEKSRLGCQIKMSKELDGLVVRLPPMSRNVQASDFVEKEKKA